ncbi:hypothetical protein PORY_002306 [Pneumocystis oryctolagi]|uniref:Uncharacterized protein n=1 Tax=Pneumocystis oryctolagi TaxID=42067 RepID=A0ACB7C9W9_9ASCO|nr:hypothetical protein PORY_002306 [Pneumocystis oryctolagi]
MNCCYWIVSIPEKINGKITTFEDFMSHLSCTTHDYAQVFKFTIPCLKVGNLDSLICQSEDLAKLDDCVKESILKVPEILKTILDNDMHKCIQRLTIDNKTIEHYLQTFQWDTMKYRTDLSISSLMQTIENELFLIEELKAKYQSYNQAKSILYSLEHKYIGDLSQRSLTDIVKKEHIIQESEYLETALISVPIYNKKCWLESYETLTPMVVCRSAFEISKDDKYILYSVVVFKKYIQEFKQKCREIKCIPRDFEYKDDLYIKEESILEDARKKENRLWAILLLAQASFSDMFQAWIHLKAMRIFVESILRYGNPPNFISVIIKPNLKYKNKARKALTSICSSFSGSILKENSFDKTIHDEPLDKNIATFIGNLYIDEYTEYIFYELSLNFFNIKNKLKHPSFFLHSLFNFYDLFRYNHSRFLSNNQRSLLSNVFVPSNVLCQDFKEIKTGHDLLIKAGFLRQSSSGVYIILPLALRVQKKIEDIIDESLYKINASKISLPNLLVSDLWKKSKRWSLLGKELFKFRNRKGIEYCLSPTHEEEITNLVAKEISRKKFRDEMRPRRGLLRGCEFIMSDLYTFDKSKQDAIQTYELVCNTYKEIFSKFELPVIMAEANNGNIGGYFSHEFHALSSSGEDSLIMCLSCGYTVNKELALIKPNSRIQYRLENCNRFYIKSINNTVVGIAYVPFDREINTIFVNKIMKNANLNISNIVLEKKTKETEYHYEDEIIHILDTSFNPDSFVYPNYLKGKQNKLMTTTIVEAKENDLCHKCSLPLKFQRSIELAHTFYLGTKYSSALSATFVSEKDKDLVPVEMGCYGIGVSRILSSLAEINKDNKGLIWPATIAPWKIVIISSSDLDYLLYNIYDMIVHYFEKDSIIIDDRKNRGFVWKMKDSDLIGFPYTIIIGKHWKEKNELEVQIRKTGEKIYIKPENIQSVIQ